MFKNTFYLFFSISVFSSVIFSEEMPLGIFVSGEDSAAATPTQGISIGSGGRFLLRLHTACFPTNLRSVSNPIAPSSMIKAQFDLTISDQKFNFFVNFPGNITTNTGMKSASITPITKEGVITYSRPGGFQVLTCTPTMGGIGGGFFGIGGMGGGFNGIGGIGGMGGGFGGIGGLGGGGSNSCTQAGYTYSFMKGYTKTITLPPIVTTEPFINHNLPNGSVAGIYGNTVQMYINAITALSRNPDGSAAAIKSPPSINSYSFNQKVMDCSKAAAVYGSVGHSSYTPTYACGAYMAKDGAVSASVTNFRLASDNSSADLTVSFPGQTGFCGGYWSPLMIFLDEKRPQFNHISDFIRLEHIGIRTADPKIRCVAAVEGKLKLSVVVRQDIIRNDVLIFRRGLRASATGLRV